jgi:hypothetical protein
MFKKKGVYIAAIALSVIIVLAAVVPLLLPAQTGGFPNGGTPPMGQAPFGGMPNIGNADPFKIQQFMDDVKKAGKLTPELEKKAKELGLPDQMIEMLKKSQNNSSKPGVTPVQILLILICTGAIGFSSYKIYAISKKAKA